MNNIIFSLLTKYMIPIAKLTAMAPIPNAAFGLTMAPKEKDVKLLLFY